MSKKFLKQNLLIAGILFSSYVFAAGGGEHGEIPWKTIGFQTFNVAVLFFIIIYFGKAKIVALFEDRRKQFQLNFEKANALLELATKQNQEIKQKLNHIKDTENETLSRAQAEAKQLLENSKKEVDQISEKMMSDVKKLIQIEIQKAKSSIVFDTLEETAALAKNVISKEVDENKNSKIVDNFQNRVGV